VYARLPPINSQQWTWPHDPAANSAAALVEGMAHVAMQQADDAGQVVTWLEHVTDEEYESRSRHRK
jgi:hypothetical protein